MQTREVDATAVRSLLAAAVAAPSIHNTQPWRFGLDPDSRSVEVWADRGRPLPMTDPDLRAQHLSVGAAVFNLRVAAAHLGWEPIVGLLPAADDPDLLARVQLARPAANGPSTLGGLYEAIERRHTSRMPFTGRPVPEPVVSQMITAARAEGARLDVPDIMGTRRLLQLTQAAEARNASHSARTAEARTRLTAPGRDTPYGIPVTALGARDASGRIPMRDFTGRLPVPYLPALHFERHAQVALLWTSWDQREDWLRAGQALQRVLLTATVHGVRTSMLHQAMEWLDLRAAMGGSRQPCSPQLLIRFGYGPEGGRTPRAAAHATPRPALGPEPAASDARAVPSD
ncbi:Acg family FMN-binding oxidoreductase [Streptomyces sp. DSM 40750]|uniref:Acg family FMN-binding oxidoreductase n=1 Tax=Streptomyces sp. DSM 40750 TaxID=2801030 RepID=UPI00214CDBC9|nr:nitroreductase family protein [Streptomyces sp. DSM 40750]UUU19017.1 nitroreductase family protein [Streptomyces sp. DSM 40750]UUU27641.1 nitroreductase family protein [Streptomyces sp. DSM 40750]